MEKKVRIGPSFISPAKGVVGSTNGYSRKFGDEEASMLWFDGERELHISMKVVQKLLKMPKALQERLTKWTDLNCFLSSVRRGDNNNHHNDNFNYSRTLTHSAVLAYKGPSIYKPTN